MIDVIQVVYGNDRIDNHRRSIDSLMSCGTAVNLVVAIGPDTASEHVPISARLVVGSPRFSLGAYRNLGTTLAPHGIIAFIDADMLVPYGFFEACIEEVMADNRTVSCPLYMLERKDGTGYNQGAGYGNCIVRRKHYEATSGYIEKTTWGGEDTEFLNKLAKCGVDQIARRQVPGFIHQWHPKPSGDWYQ